MNTNGVAKNYAQLTPEERFRLILAASGRGDDAERERLGRAGKRITLSMPDHSPHAHALKELALVFYIELLDEAHRFTVMFLTSHDEPGGRKGKKRARHNESDGADFILAYGFLLRTKADGWKLFCERLNVPAFLLWRELPGFNWLQFTLALTEGSGSRPGPAFVAEGFLRWLNDNRPAGTPELTEVPLSVEGIASETEALFRERVKWQGG
jgi:hypothetical protein